uniref:Transposase n=1 Tax=Candidatus Kentrum sp. TC TaxID=2126339 RepID=A0A450ZGI7_9GAMM|nr:MAG: hypothetical protein BECKTC1821D_GA0114238_12211 [Candidatus Kentron sp. TC]
MKRKQHSNEFKAKVALICFDLSSLQKPVCGLMRKLVSFDY